MHHRGFYVSATDTVRGNGSDTLPWSLTQALAQPSVIKGNDTIWLKDGRFVGTFTSMLHGEPGRPVVLRQYPGARATIDGALIVRGNNAEYWDFELTNSTDVRTSLAPGSDPSGYKRAMGIDVHGVRNRFINLVVHDAGGGFGLWTQSEDTEVYGCLVYNNGWQGPDRGHGHGIYAQNRTGVKVIADNVVFHQFDNGLQIYGSDQAFLAGFTLDGNVAFRNGALSKEKYAVDLFLGGATPAEHIIVRHSYTYRDDGLLTARFGYGPETINHDLALTDSYFVGTTRVGNWLSATVTGNTFTGSPQVVDIVVPAGATLHDYTWERNTYIPDRRRRVFNSDALILAMEKDVGRGYTFEEWARVTPHDHDGKTQPAPGGTEVFVRPNKYERGRAHIVVYNWALAATADVDASHVLERGDAYEVRSVQDFYGKPILTGTYDGGKIRIPMIAHPGAETVGVPGSPPPAMGPEFAVFVLMRARG